MPCACLASQSTFVPRSHAALWCVNDNIYMFGGQASGLSYLNDMWRYSSGIHQWITCFSHLFPSARKGCATWQGYDGKFYLFGGLGYQDDELVYLNDLWCFDPTIDSWNPVVLIGMQPDGRHESHVWQDEMGDIYIHGGFGAKGALDDFWRLSLRTLSWTILSPGPQPCYGAATWIYQNQFYLLGGLGQNHFWRYEPLANRWQILADTLYSHYCPLFWIDQKKFYIWSGLIPAGKTMACAEDGWTYDIEQQVWEKSQNQSDWPITPRYGASICTLHDKIIIFGGCTEKGQYHNDLWIIQQDDQRIPVQLQQRRIAASMQISV